MHGRQYGGGASKRYPIPGLVVEGGNSALYGKERIRKVEVSF